MDYWRMGTKWGNPRIPSSQLRSWSDRYAGRGLVIVSLVSYCRYVAGLTGPEGQRARKVEQEMLREWARDSGLTQRLAVPKAEPGALPIGGTAFEHVVVIDQEGKVRLIALERPDVIKAVDGLLETFLGRGG
jgi:hypothetical protein